MNVSFIGGGNMATALAQGLINKKQATHILIVEPFDAQIAKLKSLFAESINTGLLEVIPAISPGCAESDVIVLAVKPQQMEEACKTLAHESIKGLIVSIAAGTRIDSIATWLNGYQRIVRAMPNTPATLGLGITGLVASAKATALDKDFAQSVLQAAGEVLWVESEAMIDAVTAVSGSGPGYVFYLMEAMQSGAMAQGFTAQQAKLLTAHTFAGAAQLALRSHTDCGTEFSTLREQVTSKGGTTFAGLESLRASEVASAIERAIAAAKDRAQDLGKT
jgi:pyrroline-5-carboxylate reductase